jgi:thioredoxin reductase
MNYQVDIIIIGDSKNGHDLLDKIASNRPRIKVAFVSQAFKSTTTHDYLNVEYFRDEVVLVDYKNRLFGCYLKNGTRVYATHLVIASGLSYAPLVLNNRTAVGVYNNTDDIPKTAKNQPAIVICNKNADVKFALDVAKKYKQVYLCVETAAIEGLTEANAKKLEKAENIVVLYNTSLIKTISKDGTLLKAELDNYATLNCSAIYVKTESRPAVDFIPNNIIEKTEQGFLVTNEKTESTLVPKCFAVGNCAQKYTKAMEQAAVEAILRDF